jgi:autophagy-related protein 9
MLNPLGRTYQGYSQANQSLLEEEGENEGESTEEDLESGRRKSNLHQSTRVQGKQKVSWGAGASEMSILRPNIHQEDKNYEQDSSDDEVPQSFMIEASSPSRVASRGHQPFKGKGREDIRIQPPRTSPGKPMPPSAVVDVPLSIPPRPSELTFEEPHPFRSSEPSERPSPKPMRGLDAYERALWNWVNVYNLDAFLQEVYYYYEGKGIYSIALARGLNLLLVFMLSANVHYNLTALIELPDLSLDSLHSYWGVSIIQGYDQKVSLGYLTLSLITASPGMFIAASYPSLF